MFARLRTGSDQHKPFLLIEGKIIERCPPPSQREKCLGSGRRIGRHCLAVTPKGISIQEWGGEGGLILGEQSGIIGFPAP